MCDPLRTLSLFSGIGGLDLGLERTGHFRTVAFCEADRFCRRVLRAHWPGARLYRDVRTLTAGMLEGDGVIGIDAICGGFPCQDVSLAGKKVGIDAGKRTGLWSEYARLIRELRPRLAIMENVPGLLAGGGLGRVLGDLAEAGYDAEWCVLSAAGVGAPHLRERVFVVASPAAVTAHAGLREREAGNEPATEGRDGRAVRYAAGTGVGRVPGVPEGGEAEEPEIPADAGDERHVRGRAGCAGAPRLARPRGREDGTFVNPHRPFLGGDVHGLPRGVDGLRRMRIHALGNAVVPQVAERLGYMIADGGFL